MGLRSRILFEKLFEFGQKFGVKVLTANYAHYVENLDREAHDGLMFIQTGANLSDEIQIWIPTRQLHIK
jgi:DNA polymerase III alpha subunit